VIRLIYGDVRILLSGDLNIEGARRILSDPGLAAKLDAHILKAPHHGSHEYSPAFLV
jgi:beta-lactamase superfamily II metal-dependent hydrolase